MEAASRRDALVLSAAAPPWSCFTVGDQVVSTVGLWDESLHPGYYEDTDYARRCKAWGVDVVQSDIVVKHDNSTTIKTPEYAARNAVTFPANRDYYMAKAYRGDMTAGEWSLSRRRELSWD
jgi:GT2 family glycosyltransferase